QFLHGSFLDPARAPIVPVSALTGAGIGELRSALVAIAAQTTTKDTGAIFRLPIDRVFTMKGFGTVVTGTLVSGSLKKDDEVEIFPAGKRVRVRGVQVHGSASEIAIAGERTALNLASVAKEDLARGMTLAEPGKLRLTRRIDAHVSLLKSAKPLRE